MRKTINNRKLLTRRVRANAHRVATIRHHPRDNFIRRQTTDNIRRSDTFFRINRDNNIRRTLEILIRQTIRARRIHPPGRVFGKRLFRLIIRSKTATSNRRIRTGNPNRIYRPTTSNTMTCGTRNFTNRLNRQGKGVNRNTTFSPIANNCNLIVVPSPVRRHRRRDRNVLHRHLNKMTKRVTRNGTIYHHMNNIRIIMTNNR